MTQNRPQKGDYAPYCEEYISLGLSGDFLEILVQHHRSILEERYLPALTRA